MIWYPITPSAVMANAAQSRMLRRDRKSTRLNSSHGYISYAVFCLKKKKRLPKLQGSQQNAPAFAYRGWEQFMASDPVAGREHSVSALWTLSSTWDMLGEGAP